MAQSLPHLPAIDEDDETNFDWETATDPARLKRFRTTGKSTHTRSGKKLMTAVRVGEDRDTVRALRATYIRDYDELEERHDRFLQFFAPDAPSEALAGEQLWLQAVVCEHQALLTTCDDYLARLPARSTASLSSSHHSSVSSARAKIQEAERLQKEAEFRLQSAQDEAVRRAAEDVTLRQVEDYQRQVAANRQQRELRDQIELQRLSGAILKRQLNELTDGEQDQPEQTPMLPVTSASSEATAPSSIWSANPPCQTSTVRSTTVGLPPPQNAVPTHTTMTPSIGSSIPKSLTPTRLFTPSNPVPSTIATPSVAGGVFNQVRGLAARAISALTPSKPAPIPSHRRASQPTTGGSTNPSSAMPTTGAGRPPYVSTHATSTPQINPQRTHEYSRHSFPPPSGSSVGNGGTPQPTSLPFPSNEMAPPLYLPAPPIPLAPPQVTLDSSRVYTPDAWIHSPENPSALGRSGVKPPRMKAPNFDGNPRNWPMFIQMFKVFVHDAVNSDAERIAHLHDALTQAIRKDIGEALQNPGLYRHALSELHKRYGNPQIVSQACTSSLLKLQSFRDNDYKALRAFSADLHSVVATLRLGGYGMELHSNATLSQLVSKLPPALRSRWGEKSWSMQPQLSTVEDLDKWLDGIAMAEHSIRAGSIESYHEKPHRKINDGKNRSHPGHNVFNTTVDRPIEPAKCPGCKSIHYHHLKDCRQFKAVPVEKRAAIAKECNACFRCLGRDHLSRECRRSERCSQANCDGVHHPLLHGAPRMFPKWDKPKEAGFSGSVAMGSNRRILLPIVPVIVQANGKEVQLFALLDGSSEISVIKRRIAELLGLEGRVERLVTRTVDGIGRPTDHKIVEFDIASLDGLYSFNVVGAHVMDTFQLHKGSIDLTNLAEKWPHLAHVPIHSALDQDVAILIGQDHPAAIEIFESRKDPYHQRAPRAYLTAFGWCIAGPTARSGKEKGNYCFHGNLVDDRCGALLQQFMELDTFGTKPNVAKPVGDEDKRAWKILKETTKHNGERYESGLLWKLDDPALPNNFFTAQRRLLCLEKKLSKDKKLAETYKGVIDMYVNLKHARKLSKGEIDAGPSGRTWYNPHHPVFNPNKPGKCRVVFDLSAKCRGICLNDVLLRGPDLLTNLIGILLRFRQYAVPIVADVEKMFHQVRVRPIDGPAFRFLWREPGSSQPPDVYQMDVHLFGAASSPAVCSNALQQAVKDYGDDHLLKQITKHFYVDNWLASFSTEAEAISTAHRLTETLKTGGFPLTQWATSNDAVRQSLPGQQLENAVVNMDLDAEPIERTLGLVWNFNRDAFILGASVRPDGRTKRDIMKALSSIFDPLGFLSPIVLQAKFLMQDIWRRKFDWDVELDQDLIDRWIQWANSLPLLNGLALDRCISPTGKHVSTIELHVFGDASEMGFGAVCYARFVYPNGTADTSLLLSKSRIAPLKFMTIPRLELNAAVLAARLAVQAKEEHDIIFNKTIYWSDSSTVLSWIKSRSCRFNVYVGNRIGEILESSSSSQWNYVPSSINPADDASRGLDAAEFDIRHRWFSGPEYLKVSTDWPCLPSLPPLEADDPEVRETTWVGQVQLQDNEIDQLIARKSRVHIVIRTVAYMFRFIANARKTREHRKLDGLSEEEISLARNALFRHTQRNVYRIEMDDLRAGRPIESSSSLIKLSPYLDHRGIMCVGGRIDKAPVPLDVRHPIILPRHERFTQLILSQMHRDRAHSSAEQLHHEARSQYWIPKGRLTAQKAFRMCLPCKRKNAKGFHPKMADLPSFRLKVGYPAFTHTGVDYFGPIEVTILRRTVKRWGCLFTCLTSRCVHLEMAYSLDTSSFISALDRFQNRRGVPASLHSDNGTNFVGAQRELAECLQNLNQHEILKHLGRQPTKWHFNPPAAPHFGGAWERLVRSAKTALRSVLGRQRLSDEILVTALTHIENVLNSRKLTASSDDPADPESLTPNHLLLGRANPNTPPDVFSKDDLSARQRWRISQAMADQFWRRWMKEIIPSLTEREKWYQDQPNLEVGDIVVLINSSTPRGILPTGRVTQVVVGGDGIVRSAYIQTNGTEYHRPVHELLLIESVHVREDAIDQNNRRAGDVANLATSGSEMGKSVTKGGVAEHLT
ncbi:uncharacterized protein LOC130689298 [Daphnia carinata]|uniref:uncharacterized protein LOC130689298 n=1 Tax=Daphnia carinata TaxID=120202 RepID=UPI00257C98A7|nr:uncharacterized protein LOC130689298 [Daphnia carinata]